MFVFCFLGGGLSVLLLPSRLLCTHPSPSPVRLRWPPGSSALTTWTSVPKVCIYVYTHAQLTITDSNSAMSAHISLFCSCLYVIRTPPPPHTHSLWFSPSLSLSFLSLFLCYSLATELSECEAQLLELNHLLRSMEVLHRTYSAPAINALQVLFFIPQQHRVCFSFHRNCYMCNSDIPVKKVSSGSSQ